MRPELQSHLVERIIRHVDAGTTDLADKTEQHPHRGYRDPEGLRQEVSRVIRRYPTIAAHVSQLPHPGDFVTTDVAGLPVLLVRQPDGTISALVNICRHRGARVVEESCGAARANGFTCSWHGWRYDLDGALAAITDHRRSFPEVELEPTGLVRLPCEVRHGFVWVTPDPDSPVGVADVVGPLDEDLTGFALDRYDFYGADTLPGPFNWKRGLEGFLESYHFRWIHPAMKKYYFSPDVLLVDGIGRHTRLVVPKQSIMELRDSSVQDRRIRPHATIAYHVFPHTMLFLEKAHASVMRFQPVGVDRCEVRMLHVTEPGAADRAKWDENIGKFLEAVAEDFTALASAEHGADLPPAAPEAVLFGRNELGLQLFRRNLSAALAE